ncbi:MAG: hypothetical protein AABX16_02505 [Nanoarchaeota archaeon]
MKLSPEERKLMTKLVKWENPIKLVAKFFGVDRQCVWYWSTETLNADFKDLPRNKKSKIAVEV